ncbi:MAG: MMPL family transporter [Myxococcota bacterium]|nr:MMPL family transporter [Myxococcota bacterium]
MKSQIDEYFAHALPTWVDWARVHARTVILGAVVMTLVAGFLTVTRLGINSDNLRLISEDLPSRQNQAAFARLFPDLENALLVVIDARTPELAREAENILVERLDAENSRFDDAYPAAGGAFFEEHGLLYRNIDDLDLFAEEMARLQPVISALDQEPNLANLSELVAEGLEQTAQGQAGGLEPEDWAVILDSVGQATVEVYAEFPLALSWEELLLQGSALDIGNRRVVVAHPILDFGSLLAAGRAVETIQGIAEEEGLTPEQGVTVRVTGNPALNYEEMFGLGWDLGVGGVICFFFVIAVLKRALRSLRLVMAAVVTLLVGLVWTAGFAATAIGHVSLVSASFGVLFIGLGVDFAIHLGMAYAAGIRLGVPHAEALRDAASAVGGSLVICTVTTSIGFFVFVPTDYLGVAELGLIAGTGMYIIFFLTLTLLPALLSTWFVIDASQVRRELHLRTRWWRVFDTRPGLVIGIASLLMVGGLTQVPSAHFDSNVINMRDPTTPSVQAFNDLLEQSGMMSPWFVNSVVENLDAVPERVQAFEALDSVSHTIALPDYVPSDQAEKLEILADLGYLLDAPPRTHPAPTLSFDEQVEALRSLQIQLGRSEIRETQSELREPIDSLRAQLDLFLKRVDTEPQPEAAIAKLDQLLLAGFPDQIRRLKRSIETDEIQPANLPPELVARMRTPAGQARIQVFPNENLSDEPAFVRFTEDVMSVDPQAAGVAVNLVGFSRAIRDSFRQALLSAIGLIALLLLGLWRRLTPVALVLAPLALSSVLTVATMVLFGIPFNFANVVVIPLMLGIGVDSGVHLVHRAELMRDEEGDLMDSTTARAVFYSALTTLVSFGTLAFSSHRGVASLGIVLSIGMTLTVICNLIVLPALIRMTGLANSPPAGRRPA